MDYEFINETEEHEAVKDILHLHWWINENINKEGERLFSQVRRSSGKSYVNYAFKTNNSIRTICRSNSKPILFYGLMENNKVLKCSFINVVIQGELKYKVHYLLFELFDKADTFVITKKENFTDQQCFPSGTVRIKTEFITISDNSGRVITEDGEIITYRENEIEIPDGAKLVDVLKPMTADDILDAFKKAKEKSDEKIANKDKINSQLSKVFKKVPKKKPIE